MRRNVRYKLLALVIAVIIWLYANVVQSPRTSRELKGLPLAVHELDPGCIVVAAPKTVNAQLEGARAHVNSIAAQPDAITAHVNLAGRAAGRHMVPVRVTTPAGYAGLVNVAPAPREVSIVLAQKAWRTLGIDVRFIGSPLIGYRFGAPRLSRGRATVSGPSRLVSKVAQLAVTVDVGGLSADTVEGDFRVFALGKDDKPVRGLQVTPQEVHLSMKLLEAPASRAVFVGLETEGQPPFPHKVGSIAVRPQTVTVTGRPEQLMNVTTLRTEKVNLDGRTKTFSQRVRIIVLPGLALADSEYVRVTVEIERLPEPEEPSREPGTM